MLSEGGVVAGELTNPGPGVFQASQAGDAIVGDPEEVDLVDPHPSAGRDQALPLALV